MVVTCAIIYKSSRPHEFLSDVFWNYAANLQKNIQAEL